MSADRPKKTDGISSETEMASGSARPGSDRSAIAKWLDEIHPETGKIYMAAVEALANRANIERDAHCAVSLRRIVEMLKGTDYGKVYEKECGIIYGDFSEVIRYEVQSQKEGDEILECFEVFINEIISQDCISGIEKSIGGGKSIGDESENFVINPVKSDKDSEYAERISRRMEISKRLDEMQFSTDQEKLSEIYEAAVAALKNNANIERDAHCAVSLRRILRALFGTGYGRISVSGYSKINLELSSVVHYGENTELKGYQILDRFEEFINEITFKDISKIKKAINKGNDIDLKGQRPIITLVKSGRDHGYFFSHVESHKWLEPLRQQGLLKVKIEKIEGKSFLQWPAQRYLSKLAEQGRKEAAILILDELKNLKKYHKAPPEFLLVIFYRLSDLVSRLSEDSDGDAKTKEIAREVFRFFLAQKEDNGFSLYDSLGIRTYLENDPWDAICILIDVVQECCKADNFKGNTEKRYLKLLLESCKFFYKENLDNYERRMELDKLLRRPIPGYERDGHPFDHVRYALYTHHPDDQTRGWIKEAIIDYPDYSKREYHDHFQQMIRKSFSHFGKDWLTKKELEPIFRAIFSGPDSASRKQTGKNRKKRRNYFRRVQLSPFEPALFGEFKEFWESIPEDERRNIENEHYTGGNLEVDLELRPVEPQSPRTIEELGQMSNEQLVDYLANWNEPRERMGKDFVTSIDFRGLSNALRELVLKDPGRFLSWKEKEWVKIKKPVYFLAFVEAAKQRLEKGHDEELERWLNVMEWILSRHDREEEKRDMHAHDGSEFTWNNIQVECAYFLSGCIGRLPFECRERILNILKTILKDRDLRLKQWEEEKSSQDAFDEAASTKRGMALEVLVKEYPQWVQRHEGEASQVSEVFEILEERLSRGPAMTPPEHALLGHHFGKLLPLNRSWIMRNKRRLFPLDNFLCWRAAFGCALLNHYPCREMFTIFEEDYFYAFEKIEELGDDEVNGLGVHMFFYWLWNEMPEKNLIEAFFEKAKSTHKRHVLNRMGSFFSKYPEENEEEYLQTSIGRAQQFIEQRIEKEDIDELVGFETWLDAECFEASWRLDTLEKLLKKGTQIPWHAFSKVLMTSKEQYPRQVMVCFLEAVKHSITIWLENDNDRAEEILGFGLTHPNTKVSNLAMEIREQLLQLGYDRIVDLE